MVPIVKLHNSVISEILSQWQHKHLLYQSLLPVLFRLQNSHPTLQIINKDVNWYWLQYWPLSTPAVPGIQKDFVLLLTAPLSLAVQLFVSIPHCLVISSVFQQFLCENLLKGTVKSLAEVKNKQQPQFYPHSPGQSSCYWKPAGLSDATSRLSVNSECCPILHSEIVSRSICYIRFSLIAKLVRWSQEVWSSLKSPCNSWINKWRLFSSYLQWHQPALSTDGASNQVIWMCVSPVYLNIS